VRDERDVQWSAPPLAKGPSQLCHATMQLPAYGFLRSHMGDATSSPCCYSFTHDT
jgi:hypothetical protein